MHSPPPFRDGEGNLQPLRLKIILKEHRTRSLGEIRPAATTNDFTWKLTRIYSTLGFSFGTIFVNSNKPQP